MGNSEKGRWVTVNGRHIFISDDQNEKQEREIAESQKRASEYNKSRQTKTDPVKDNPYYRGLAEDAKKVLSTKDSDFESLTDKSVELYKVISAFNKYGIDKGETYEKLLKENRRIEAITHDAYVNTGRYDDEVKKYSAKKSADAELEKKVKKLREENPNDYVTRYGIVLKGHNRSLGALEKAVKPDTEVHFVDGRAERPDNPTGAIDIYKGWKEWNWDDSLVWGHFVDTDGKKKIWFYLSD